MAFAQLTYRESLRDMDAVPVYVPIAIIKKQLNLSTDLYTISQIVSPTLFENPTGTTTW